MPVEAPEMTATGADEESEVDEEAKHCTGARVTLRLMMSLLPGMVAVSGEGEDLKQRRSKEILDWIITLVIPSLAVAVETLRNVRFGWLARIDRSRRRRDPQRYLRCH